MSAARFVHFCLPFPCFFLSAKTIWNREREREGEGKRGRDSVTCRVGQRRADQPISSARLSFYARYSCTAYLALLYPVFFLCLFSARRRRTLWRSWLIVRGHFILTRLSAADLSQHRLLPKACDRFPNPFGQTFFSWLRVFRSDSILLFSYSGYMLESADSIKSPGLAASQKSPLFTIFLCFLLITFIVLLPRPLRPMKTTRIHSRALKVYLKAANFRIFARFTS